ncbi:MAG: BatA and WFA domain-containing protein [Polyangiaceae bacterium]
MPWELTRISGLGLLGLLAPLALLYVLKVRREKRVVPSVWLWQAALRDLSAKSPFKRLTASVPLVLESLAIVALGLALAGPITRSASLKAARVALVVDVSASMASDEGGQTRLGQAVSAARGVLLRTEPGTELLLVAAGREPELISPFERDRARLEAALGRIRVREVEGQLGRSLNLAADQLQKHGGGKLVVITDGALADSQALTPLAIPVEVIHVGSAHENSAIVRADITRTKDPVTGRDRVEAFAQLVNFGSKRRELFVTLTQKNVQEPLASRRVQLEAGEHAGVVLSFEAAPGDAGKPLELELSPHDALLSDDRAALVVPEPRKLPVVVAPKTASPWLLRALTTDADIELYTTTLEGLTRAEVADDAFVVVDGACPATLPGADLLILNPPQGTCRGVSVGAELSRPQITSWAETDPRLRFLSFEGVDVASGRSLGAASERDSLVHTRDGTLVADASSPGRMATLVGFDLGQSSFPLKASFVVFVRNLTDLARAHRTGAARRGTRTGEPISLHVPNDIEAVDVEYPDGRREKKLRARNGLAVLPGSTQVGTVFVSWTGIRPGSATIATNLNSEAESRSAPLPLSIGRAREGSGRALAEFTRLDWIFGALALALIAADVAWLTRRRPSGRFNVEASP